MNIKECIETLQDHGWSQDDIAKLLGVTRPTIRKVLDGDTVNLSHISYKLLKLVAASPLTLNQIKKDAFMEYIDRHFLRTAYLELASEIDAAQMEGVLS